MNGQPRTELPEDVQTTRKRISTIRDIRYRPYFGIFKGLFINYITHLRGRGSVTPGLRVYRCYEGGDKCYARAKLLQGELYARAKGIEVLWGGG